MSKQIAKAVVPVILCLFLLSITFGTAVFASETTTSGTFDIQYTPSSINASKAIIESDTGYITTNTAISGEFNLSKIQQAVMPKTTGSGIIMDSVIKKEVVFLLDTSGALSFIDRQSRSAFSYGIFSGSASDPFKLENKTASINGDIHSNAYIQDSSGKLTVQSGVCESVGVHNIFNVGKYDWNGRTEAEAFKDNVAARTMPDISQIVKYETHTDYKIIDIRKKKAGMGPTQIQFTIGNNAVVFTQNSGDTMLRQSYFPINSVDPDFPVGGFPDLYLSYVSKIETEKNITRTDLDTFVISGPSISNFVIKDKQTYYFNGNVIVRPGSLRFEGSGRLVATGDILVEGMDLKSSTGTSSLIYSEGGSIKIYTGGAPTLNGVVYAPHGIAYLGSSNITINGSVAADKVFIAAEGITINSVGNFGPNSDIEYSYKVSYLDTAVATINTFRTYTSTAAASIRIGILQYNETANNNDFNLYDIKNDAGSIDSCLGKLKSAAAGKSKMPSNLGDGLRRAYEMLNSGEKDAAKYVVVISGSIPNAWTVAQNTDGSTSKIGYYYKEGDSDSVLTGTSIALENLAFDSNSGSTYAKGQVAKINSLNNAGKSPNTAFFAICMEPKRSDPEFKNISDSGWSQISNTVTSLNTRLPSAFTSINNGTSTYAVTTGNDLAEETMVFMKEQIDNKVSNVTVTGASITFNLPKGTYFNTATVPGITLSGENNLLDLVNASGASQNKIVKSLKINCESDPLNSGKFTFTIPDMYIPLKYIPTGTTYDNTGVKEALTLSAEAKLIGSYDVKQPNGETVKKPIEETITYNPYIATVVDRIDVD